MSQFPVLKYIKELKHQVFTTRDIAAISGKSLSSVTQGLNYLAKQGVVNKIYHGVWAEMSEKPLSPYLVMPCLFPTQRAYVSFTTALHMYGMIEQVPGVLTIASMGHSRTIRTAAGVFTVHQLTPKMFDGFDWYHGMGNFLIAQPEKALVDCLYISTRKKNLYGNFPELHFPEDFSRKLVSKWINIIPDSRIKNLVREKAEAIEIP